MNPRLPAAAIGLALLATSCALPAPPSGSGSSKNSKKSAPPAKDVRITNCAIDSTLRLPEAELKIVNRSSKTSDYVVSVEFLDANGDRWAEGTATVSSLAPKQKASKEATGDGSAVGQVKCRVTKVERYASV